MGGGGGGISDMQTSSKRDETIKIVQKRTLEELKRVREKNKEKNNISNKLF